MAGGDKNTLLCPMKSNSNTIELTVHTSCIGVLDLLCVNIMFGKGYFQIDILRQEHRI